MKDATEIVCIIDKSGSMAPRANDAVGGFNQFLSEQQQLPDEAYLTLVLFDTTTKVLYESAPIKGVQPLSKESYSPSGCTALLDAVGHGIDRLGVRLGNLPEEQRPNKILVVILTDGEENSSREFSKQAIKDKIELQRNTYNWEFIYLGANQDAFAEANGIGIPRSNAVNVDLSTTVGVANSYAFMSRASSTYRGTGSI